MIAFEYQPPSERHDNDVSLHNNYFDERTGTFDHPLFSNGYYPIALISDEVDDSQYWNDFCRWLHKEKPSVTVAMDMAFRILAKIGTRS